MGDLEHAQSFRDLLVYKKARHLSREIFGLTKTFPKEEMYSLTDQIRRSSRSVGANLAEAWAKRRYEKHFAMANNKKHNIGLELRSTAVTSLKTKGATWWKNVWKSGVCSGVCSPKPNSFAETCPLLSAKKPPNILQSLTTDN